MIRKNMVGVVAFGFAAALSAEVATQKYDWYTVNGIQEVHVEAN
jgi:hypothetical protein